MKRHQQFGIERLTFPHGQFCEYNEKTRTIDFPIFEPKDVIRVLPKNEMNQFAKNWLKLIHKPSLDNCMGVITKVHSGHTPYLYTVIVSGKERILSALEMEKNNAK